MSSFTLSFIPVSEQTAYLSSFRSNATVNNGQRIGGEAARRVLMQSKLPVNDLGKIWELSDITHTGSLSQAEFMLAMFLTQSRIKGKELPALLPAKISAEIISANGSSQQQHQQVSVPQPQPPPLAQPQTQPQPVNMPTSVHFSSAPPAPEEPSVQDFETRFPDIVPEGGVKSSLRSVRQSFHQNMLGTRVGEQQKQWVISPTEKAQYEAIFRRWDPIHRGVLRGEQAREVFAQSNLPQQELAQVWSLSDTNNQGELNLDEFSVAMHLIFRRLAGDKIPQELPQELVPRSSKDFMDSLMDMKDQLMFKDIMKPTSTHSTGTPQSRSRLGSTFDLDASARNRYSGSAAPLSPSDNESDKEGDDGGVYKSANRHRRTPMRDSIGSRPGSALSGQLSATTVESLNQLRKDVQARKDEVERLKRAIDKRKKEQAEVRVSSRWKIDDLKREIEDIHRTTPLPSVASTDNAETDRALTKRNKLIATINDLVERMPGLIRDYEKLTRELADTQKDVIKKKHAAGQSTHEANDMESRAARLMAQRMAALTGETMEDGDSALAAKRDKDVSEAEKKMEERLDHMQTVKSGADKVKHAMSELTFACGSGSGLSKWERGEGADNEEVRELIDRFKSIERMPMKTRKQPIARVAGISRREEPVSAVTKTEPEPAKPNDGAPSIAERLAKATSKQDRDRILQEIAEERFKERQQALGETVEEEEVVAKPPEMKERRTSVSNPFGNDTTTNFIEEDDDDDEWDRDDSSSDDDGPPKQLSEEGESFNTAFGQLQPTPPPTQLGNTENNPFAQLLSASTNNKEGEEGKYEKLRLRALYPYNPAGEGELTVEPGELLETRAVPANLSSRGAHADEGWMYGELLRESDKDGGDGWEPSGKVGWFPKEYADSLGGPDSRGWKKTRAMFGTAKYDYQPQHEDELKVRLGDRVRVLDGDKAESWWKARCIRKEKPEEGMLPAIYIDLDE